MLKELLLKIVSRSPVAERVAIVLALALAVTSCRPDQIEHLKDHKRIGIEAENWEVKRIMPKDLLHATRWAGDSLTATADTLLRQTMTRELAAGGVARAAAFCRPETYHLVDSLAGVFKTTARRVSERPRNPASKFPLLPEEMRTDTTRTITRPSQEVFFYQRPIVLNNKLCLRCHGEINKDILPVSEVPDCKEYYSENITPC